MTGSSSEPGDHPSMDLQTSQRIDAAIVRLIAEVEQHGAEMRKGYAEIIRSREDFWYPVAIAAGLMAVGAAFGGALAAVIVTLARTLS